jgi:hypothetical protein
VRVAASMGDWAMGDWVLTAEESNNARAGKSPT